MYTTNSSMMAEKKTRKNAIHKIYIQETQPDCAN